MINVGLLDGQTIQAVIFAKQLKKAGYTPFLISYQETWISQLILPLIVGTISSKTDFINEMNNNKTSFANIKNEIFDIMDLINSNGNSNGLEIYLMVI